MAPKMQLAVQVGATGVKEATQELSSFGRTGAQAGRDVAAGLAAAERAAAPAQAGLAATSAAAASVEQAMSGTARAAAVVEREMTRALAPIAASMTRLGASAAEVDQALSSLKTSLQPTALRAYTSEVDALRAAFVPGAAAAQKFEQQMASIARGQALGALSTSEADSARTAAKDVMEKTQRLAVANTNELAKHVKLTRQQVVGLGYQLNDVTTMLMMGASPFQILASQGGQVLQVLGDGPGGVKGSLKALGATLTGLATPANLIAVGLMAAAGSAVYFATRAGDSVKDASVALEEYRHLIESLEHGYDAAAVAAQRMNRAGLEDGATVMTARIAQSEKVLRATLAYQRQSLGPSPRSFLAAFEDMSPLPVDKVTASLQRLGEQVRSGEISVAAFREELATIMLDPSIAQVFRDSAAQLLQASDNALQLEAALAAVAKAGEKVSDGKVFGREQRESIAATIDALRMQVDMFGQSEGAIAEATMRAQALAQARREADKAQLDEIDPGLIAYIDEQSAAYGRLTDQMAALEKSKTAADAAQDLAFERSLFGLSDAEKAVRQFVRSSGLEYESAAGRQLAADYRLNRSMLRNEEALHNLHDTAMSGFMDIVEAIGKGETALDSLTGALAGVGRMFASIGAQNLFGTLMGGEGVSPRGSAPGMVQEVGRSIGKAAAVGLRETWSGSQGKGLDPRFDSALSEMLSAAPAAIRAQVQVTSGFRTVAQQAKLYAEAIEKYGSAAAARHHVAPPGRSLHNSGNAADLSFGSDTARQWVHDNAERYGLKFPMAHEPWHIEPSYTRGGPSIRSSAGAYYNDNNPLGARPATGAIPVPTSRVSALQRDRWMNGLTVGAAALGAFGSGYESGNVLSGGLSGALAGAGATSALTAMGVGAAAGPIGIIGGALLGVVGGLFGNNKKKKEARRQARQQWEEMQPQFRAFRDSLSGYGATSGIASAIEEGETQLASFSKASGAARTGGAAIAETRRMLTDYQERMRQGFRDVFEPTLRDLSAGYGFEGAFKSARDNVRKAGEQIQTLLKDTATAFGQNSDAVRQAKDASVAYSLTLLEGDRQQSEIQKHLDALYGAGQGVADVLQSLGVSAQEAARAIEEHLSVGIGKLRAEFDERLWSDIADGMGQGYLNSLRNLIRQRDQMVADAKALGSDPALIGRWFAVQAQAIVDGSNLSGDALHDLAGRFPQLAGVVSEATSSLADAIDKAEDGLRTAYESRKGELEELIDRLSDFGSAVSDFRRSLWLDSQVSVLSPVDRLARAQKEFRDTAAAAAAGDAAAQAKLIDTSSTYLQEARGYYASSESYFAAFNEVQATLAASANSATQQIDVAVATLSTLNQQVGQLIAIQQAVLTVPEAIAQLNAAEQARALAQEARDNAGAVALQNYVQAMNSAAAAVQAYKAPSVTVSQAPAVTAAPTIVATAQEAAKLGLHVTAPYPVGKYDLEMRQGVYRQYGAATYFVPDGVSDLVAWGAYTYRYGDPNRVMSSKREGGLIGLQSGGIVGNGVYDQDTVLARYAGGGNIMLAGGEMVVRAPHVTPETYPILEAINRTGRVPERDLGLVVEAVAQVRGEVRRLSAVIAEGAMATVSAVENGNALARERVGVAKRMGAA